VLPRCTYETHGRVERHPLAAGDAEEGVLPGLGSRLPFNLLLLIGLAKTHRRGERGFLSLRWEHALRCG
jgi:hypothetical protein